MAFTIIPPYNASSSLMSILILDPFGGAKPRLLRRGKEPPLRVNLRDKVNSELPNLHSVFGITNFFMDDLLK
jgi:hypothetical protein